MDPINLFQDESQNIEGASAEANKLFENELLNDTAHEEQQIEQNYAPADPQQAQAPVSDGWAAAVEAQKAAAANGTQLPTGPAPEEQPAPEVAAKATEEPTSDRIAGSGAERDPISAIAAWGRDVIDNVFEGDQVTYDEIRDKISTKMAEKVEEDKNANPILRGLAEPKRAFDGAILGAAEKTLGATEVLGDTIKAATSEVVKFATLGNVAPGQGEDGSQNPFSDNYDWATWNLGKDEYGAQTGVGKLAQGLGEFAIIASATGGGNAAGALISGGAKKALATGGVKALAKETAKAVGKEGLQGIIPDMISAVSGEGNFANLLENVAPQLKDTWITALAIDKDDNVWEAAVKTGIDGFALGIPTSFGISGAAKGVRALRKGGDVVEAVKSAQPVIQPNEQLEKVGTQIMASGNTERFERFSQIQDLNAKGIPTTWDDAAAVVPEYFAPAVNPRAVSDDFGIALYDRLDEMVEQGLPGGTFDPFTGESPVSGTMVAIDGAVLDNLDDQAEVAAFIAQNRAILERDDVYLGSWVEPETGKPVVELSRLVEDADEAEMLGRLFDQKALFRLDDFTEIPVDGSDALRQTKGQHLRSAYTTPNEPTITPPQRVAAQQIEASTSLVRPANGGGGGRLATNAQVKQIAEARGDGAGEIIDDFIKKAEVDESDLAKEARLKVSTLRDIVEKDLADFLDVDGKLIKDAFDTIQHDGQTILSRRGAFQVRAMMANTSSAIYDAAFKVSKNAAEGIPTDMHVATMKDNLLALLQMHKRTSNLLGTRLADYSISVADMDMTMKGFMDPGKGRKLDETLESAKKELDQMVDGLQSRDPKALQQAQRTAAMLQLTGGDVTKMVDVAANVGKLGTESALKLMYNSMLSSPATHLVNNLSNAFNMVYRPLSMAVGGNAKIRKSAIASYHNFWKTVPEAIGLAHRTMKTGVSNVGGSRTDLTQNQVTTIALKELSQQASDSGNLALKAGSGLVHMMNDLANFPLFDWPSRFLTTSDEFFKVMVTRMEYNRFTMEKAIDLAGSEGESAVQEAFERLLKSEYSRNFTKSGGVINEDLLKGAKEVTFQTELKGVAGELGSIVNNFPPLRLFFPFVKTGHNVLVYTGTHVPVLNLALKESREVIFKDTAEGAMMRGRVAFGTATLAGASMLAINGLITGNGPAGGQRRKEWLKTHQPRSLRVGDRWVSYERIEPFGQLLAAVADVHYAFDSGELEEDKAKYLAGYLTHALAVNLTDKSMLQGLEPLSALLNSRNFSEETLLAFAAETGNNFVPLAGARRALTNAMNPYMQEFASELERVKYSASMGMMGERAPYIDWLTGEQITASNGGLGNAILPIKTVKRGQDPVKDALEDIEFDTSVVSDELGGVELTPQQRSSFQKYISETGIYNDLKSWVTKPGFKEAVNDYKAKVRQDYSVRKEDQFFYREITRKLRAAKKVAILRLKQEYPDLNAEIMMDKYAAQADRLPNGYQSLINFGNQ